jgi:SpoVK/Ycf46/Vps4 family AAA+-type ATPase
MSKPNDTEAPDATVRALREALARGGEQALVVHLARFALDKELYAEAFEALRDVVLDDPGNIDALEVAARALRALDKGPQADRYLAAAQRLERAHAAVEQSGSGVVLQLVPPADVPSGAVTLRDVAGMEKVKRRLNLSFLGPLRNPQLRAAYGKSLRGGLLLWGPPGCGKTFLAKAVAGELGAKFINVGLHDILDMYMGQSEKNIRSLFDTARRQAPCVLFFDELDALGQKRSNLRGSMERNAVVQLLTELDGVDSVNEGVFVLGATNHPWDVDTALRRPGRFDRTLLVLPPDAAAREAILHANLADRPTAGLDLKAIAKLTEGYSGADLVHLCESATELALADAVESQVARPIQQSDVASALSEVRESTSQWLGMARNYAEFADNSREAYSDLLDYLRMNHPGGKR